MVNLSRRFLVCAAASLGFAGVGRADDVSTKAAPSQKQQPCLGAVLPLAGIYALQGDEVWRGIQLAVDTVNAAGGVAGAPVTVALEAMPTQASAAAAVNELISDKGANILFGSGDSALSYVATASAELAQVPFIELTASADGIVNRGFKFLLRTGPDTGMIGLLAAQTIKNRYAGRRLGLLFNAGATAGAIAAATIAALGATKLPITLAIAYPEDAGDLLAQTGRMMRAGVEVLLHAAGPDDTLALFQAMQSLSWRPPVLIGCGTGYKMRDTQIALGAALNGTLVIAAPFYPGQAATIAKDYEARYGIKPRSADSCTAYVGAKLVLDTLNAVKGDPSALLGAMRQLALPLGALANGFGVAFNDAGQNTASFVTLQSWQADGLMPTQS